VTLATLPDAHWALWLPARLVVRLGVSRVWLRGVSLNEVLAVVATETTLAGKIARRFFREAVIDPCRAHDVVLRPEHAGSSSLREDNPFG
jgi:hypothetical protein